jgi:hypothetical protein
MSAFAPIDQEALLAMNQHLKPLEFQVFSVYKMEEFLGGGICRLNKKEICEKYHFKSYDYFTTASKSLENKKWIFVTPEGVTCRKDFSPESFEKEELRNSKPETPGTENFSADDEGKLRNSKSKAENSDFLTENFSVEEENQLRISKLPTEKFSVADLEFLSSPETALKDLEFKDSRTEVFANAHTSVSATESPPEENSLSETPSEEKPKNRKPDSAFEQLAELCFFIKPDRLDDLSGKQRGQIKQALEKMRKKRFDLSKIPKFHEWWETNWRSGFDTGNYEPPRPNQVDEYWNVAMQAKEIAKEIKDKHAKLNGKKSADSDLVNNGNAQHSQFADARHI